MFYNKASYSKQTAKEVLNDESLHLVGLTVIQQYKYVDNKRTDKVTGLQVWVATESHNPFKIKLPAEYDVDLSSYKIGDVITFENLEAITIKQNVYFRADSIKKGK